MSKRCLWGELALFVTCLLVAGCGLLSGPVGDGFYSVLVFEDSNGNGVKDPAEKPMGNIRVEVIYPDSGKLFETNETRENGKIHRFLEGQPCTTYELVLIVPDGYLPTTPVKIRPTDCQPAMFGLQKEITK